MKIGDKFYDERNCRYLTVDGVGTDPQVYACIVEELTDDGEDFEITGRALFKEYELKHMEVIA